MRRPGKDLTSFRLEYCISHLIEAPARRRHIEADVLSLGLLSLSLLLARRTFQPGSFHRRDFRHSHLPSIFHFANTDATSTNVYSPAVSVLRLTTRLCTRVSR
jgi:hypothetical protein